MGCLQSDLGRAMEKHPDWYLVAVVARGDGKYEVHGLEDHMTLKDARAAGDALTPDEMRLAMELTPREKRKLWGVRPTDVS